MSMAWLERVTLLGVLALALAGCSTDDLGELSGDDAGGVDTGAPDGGEQAAGVDLRRIDPATGSTAGGTAVELTGSGFAEGVTVRFGATPAAEITRVDENTLQVVTPPADSPGAVTVVVTNPDGGIDAVQAGFTYLEGDEASIGFCRLQAQSPASAQSGEATERLYAVVFADGITPGDGQGSGIVGELGYGPVGAAHEAFSYQPMTYNTDIDGLAAGDRANDEYGASLQVASAGDYRYAARFRPAENPEGWVYCDLDGNENGVSAEQYGVLTVTDPPTPTIGFCVTETATASASEGEPSQAITGLVYAAGQTSGAGAGADLSAELVWGDPAQPPSAWTERVSASYAGDVDGLAPGDAANDRWTATVTAAAAGEYGYAYRFSLDGGQSWTWCDTDGSDPAAGGFEADKVGALTVATAGTNPVDGCRLQFPELVSGAEVGAALPIYGRVREPGVTGMGQASADLKAQLLVGPASADPSTDPAAFTAIDAGINTNTIGLAAGEDEYVAEFTPAQAGDFAFLYRFSADGGATWRLCDLDGVGAQSAFDPRRVGFVQVSDPAPDLVDYCRVWQQTVTGNAADPAPVATVEVYEAGLTEGNVGANHRQLEVEVGYGPDGVNPALPGAYTWSATPLPFKGLRPGNPNNYEYEGPIYDAAPAVGTYDAVVRVREVGMRVWTYCDADPTTVDFHTAATTSLVIKP